MRDKHERSFRLLDLPRDKQWRTTRESVRWTNRHPACPWCSNRHLKLVKTARSSRELMCSLLPRQRQPATTRQRHSLEGTDARRRWYRVSWLEGVVRRMSSPLMLTMLQSFSTSNWPLSFASPRNGRNGLRQSRACMYTWPEGVKKSISSCGPYRRHSPNAPNSCDSSHAITGTDQLLPTSVCLMSWCCWLPRRCLTTLLAV